MTISLTSSPIRQRMTLDALARLYGPEIEAAADRRAAQRKRRGRFDVLLALGLVVLAEVFALTVIAFTTGS